jgi:lipopolysaccharide export system protein LptA
MKKWLVLLILGIMSVSALAVQLGGGGTQYPEAVKGPLSISGTLEVTATIFHGVLYDWPSLQGAANTYLKNDGAGLLTWEAIGGGTVTQIDSGAALFGGPINYSGTLEVKYDNSTIGLKAGSGSLEVVAQGISNSHISNSAAIDATKISGTALTQSTSFAGDVSGTYGSLAIGSGKVTSTMILDGTIANGDINASAGIVYTKLNLSNSIVAGDLTSGAVTSAKILDGTIADADFGTGVVTSGAIAADAVTTAKILNANVTGAKIADNTVTAVKMGTDSITSDAIAASAVGASELATDAVTTAKILNANVTGAKIADNTITAAKMGTSSVTSDAILDGTIANGDINGSAAIDATKISGTALTQSTSFAGDVSGTYGSLAIGSGKVTSTMILDGTIANGDINASAGIVYTKLNLSNSIVAGDLTSGAVTSAKILDGTIAGGDLASDINISTTGTVSSGALYVTGHATVAGTVEVGGDLTKPATWNIKPATNAVNIVAVRGGSGDYSPGQLDVYSANDGAVSSRLMGGKSGGATSFIQSPFFALGTTNANGYQLYNAGTTYLVGDLKTGGNVSIGTTDATAAKLTVGNSLAGTTWSSTFKSNAGTLGSSIGNELVLASIGFNTGNFDQAEAFGIRAYRVLNGSDWQDTAVGFSMDLDGFPRTNGGQLWLHSNGNVGIGTSADPQGILHVVQTGGGKTLVLQNTNGGCSTDLSLYNDVNSYSRALNISYTNSNGNVIPFNNGGFAAEQGAMYTAGNYALTFGTNNTYRAMISNSGKVGIGTTSPGQLLTVNGTIETIGTGGIKFPDATTQTTAAAMLYDNTTVGLNGSGSLEVKNAGITAAKMATSSVTSDAILDGTIVNGDINASAAIAATKISGTALTQSTSFAGDVSGTYGSLAIGSGKVTSTMILDGTIANGDINASAGIVYTKLNLSNSIVAGDLTSGAVTSAKILDGTIADADFGTGVVTAGAIAADAVITAKILNANVTGAKIAANTITAAKMGTDSITSDAIAASAVGASELATDAVTTAKILNVNVTGAKIADNTITAAKMGTDSITSDAIAASAVGASELATDAVTTAKILDKNVTGAKIADNTITAAKMGTSSVTSDAILDQTIVGGDLATDISISTIGKITSEALHTTGNAVVGGNLKVTGTIEGENPVKIAGGLNILTGNVGIGTTNPDGSLHIIDDSVYNNNLYNAIRVDSTKTDADVMLMIGVDSAIDAGYLQTMSYNSWSNRPLVLNAYGGNVGIGTTSPKNELDIEGGMAVGATYSGTSTAPSNGMIVEGKVGIGTPEPKVVLHVVGSVEIDGNLKIAGTIEGGSPVQIAGGLQIISGNLGIGTTEPNSLFDVSGKITADEVLITGTTEVDGRVSYLPSAVTEIHADAGITEAMLNKKVILIKGLNFSISVEAEPPINKDAASDGQMIVLIGTIDNQCVTFNSGSNSLKLSANTPFTLGKGDILQLIFVKSLGTGGCWVEISRTDN